MADKIQWPANLEVQGLMSFPIYSKENIEELVDWRKKKNIPAPKYDDKIGGTLLLGQRNWDKAYAYLTQEYLPFVDTLYKDTDGKKGIHPDLVKELLDQALSDTWIVKEGRQEKPNMPLRRLTDKDRENLPEGFEAVGKLKFAGPYPAGTPITRKAVVYDSQNKQSVVSLQDLRDDEVLPENRADENKLWWGAGWHFRTQLRFNAFDAASVGVTAYADNVYLLPHLGLPTSGGADAAIIADDGDDAWDDAA